MWLVSIFIAALAIWSGILWFVLPVDIFRYSLVSMVAMHMAVPSAVIALWFFARHGYRVVQQRKAVVAEAAQRDIREAEKARQRHQFDEALKNRRTSIHCLWAVTGDVIFHVEAKPLTEDTAQTATCFFTPPATSNIDWPQAALSELFSTLFSAMPGAMTLPIAVCGPKNCATVEHEAMIRAVRQAAVTCEPESVSKLISSDIVVLPDDTRDVYTSIHNLFMRRRDWPAILLVAFDNRLADTVDAFDVFGEQEKPLSEVERGQGKRGRAISLLVLSQPELIDVLPKLEELGEARHIDNVTPYWERQKIPVGMAGQLMKWPKAWRDNFSSMQPIAALHRPAFCEIAVDGSLSTRVKKMELAIAEAAINSSLKSLDFVFDGEVDSQSDGDDQVASTRWLFHNAGDISCCGDRIAAVSLAMWQVGIELNPIDQATNAVMAIGDCGVATRFTRFALAVQRVSIEARPVICVEFSASECVVNFLVPYQRAS